MHAHFNKYISAMPWWHLYAARKQPLRTLSTPFISPTNASNKTLPCTRTQILHSLLTPNSLSTIPTLSTMLQSAPLAINSLTTSRPLYRSKLARMRAVWPCYRHTRWRGGVTGWDKHILPTCRLKQPTGCGLTVFSTALTSGWAARSTLIQSIYKIFVNFIRAVTPSCGWEWKIYRTIRHTNQMFIPHNMHTCTISWVTTHTIPRQVYPMNEVFILLKIPNTLHMQTGTCRNHTSHHHTYRDHAHHITHHTVIIHTCSEGSHVYDLLIWISLSS